MYMLEQRGCGSEGLKPRVWLWTKTQLAVPLASVMYVLCRKMSAGLVNPILSALTFNMLLITASKLHLSVTLQHSSLTPSLSLYHASCLSLICLSSAWTLLFFLSSLTLYLCSLSCLSCVSPLSSLSVFYHDSFRSQCNFTSLKSLLSFSFNWLTFTSWIKPDVSHIKSLTRQTKPNSSESTLTDWKRDWSGGLFLVMHLR